jgi:hypothetical protein
MRIDPAERLFVLITALAVTFLLYAPGGFLRAAGKPGNSASEAPIRIETAISSSRLHPFDDGFNVVKGGKPRAR